MCAWCWPPLRPPTGGDGYMKGRRSFHLLLLLLALPLTYGGSPPPVPPKRGGGEESGVGYSYWEVEDWAAWLLLSPPHSSPLPPHPPPHLFNQAVKGHGGGGGDEEDRRAPTPRNSGGGGGGGGGRGGRSVCKISEFPCSRGAVCISSDKFCNGVEDCADASDEPPHCTPCNRTYYGEWGRTYSLQLSQATLASALRLSHHQQLLSGGGEGEGASSSSQTPHFVCQLTFAAAGENFGDLVQIMLDEMKVGEFASPTLHGCPHGSLQVAEISRPITGGKWCGSGQGYSVYFSEMNAIALTLTLGSFPLLKMNSSGGGGGGGVSKVSPNDPLLLSPPLPHLPFDFNFKIRYKFIPRSLASVRYGGHGSPVERGEVVPGTYCSRDFEACHRRRCKIQSPNYPGLYPRNLTCHFRVRHREKQPCKHVLIQVAQLKSHKVQLKTGGGATGGGRAAPSSAGGGGGGQTGAGPPPSSSSQSLLIQEDAVVAWEECTEGRDTLTVYDGNSVEAPILLRMCGGGHVPPITSSGPEVLVVFRATPYGNPLDPKPSPPYPEPLRGFELDVDVIMVDSESADYSNFNNCTFFFVSKPSDKCLLFKPQEYGGNWISGKTGKVTSPRHTLPPNTTCRYEFKGAKDETVWIYFLSYRRSLQQKDGGKWSEGAGNCSNRLSIRDGLDSRNEALLGTFCDSDLPKLCDHKALQNESRVVRACTDTESYMSAGSRLIIEQNFQEGTALRPVHYQFYYEFVSRHAGTDGTCNRHFDLSKMKGTTGQIRTSDNVFDFGRGGRQNLTCTYTFSLAPYDALRLTVRNSSFGDRPCRTVTDFETSRYVCSYSASPSYPNSLRSDWRRDYDRSGGGNDSYSSSDSKGYYRQGQSNSTLGRGSPFATPGLPPRSELQIYEEIWPGAQNLTSHPQCICSNSSGAPGFIFTFLGRKVVVTFRVEEMTGRDSYENFFVHLDYQVVKGGGCRGDNHHMTTESGLISLESSFSQGPRSPSCQTYPWLLEAKEKHSLYLRIPGFPMLEEKRVVEKRQQGGHSTFRTIHPSPPPPPPGSSSSSASKTRNGNSSISNSSGAGGGPDEGMDEGNLSLNNSRRGEEVPHGLAKQYQMERGCPTTKNRILIYDGRGGLVQKICPSSSSQLNKKSGMSGQIVEIYSEDFAEFHSPLFPPVRAMFLIEFIGKELGSYQIKWLELISAKMKTTLKGMAYDVQQGAGNLSLFPVEIEEEETRRRDELEEVGTDGVRRDWLMRTRGEGEEDEVCPSYCPELRACISQRLWCDGEIHCPVSELDEKRCDSFWGTVNQLLSPAVYIPALAALASALSCCLLVALSVAVKRMVLKMKSKGQLGLSSSTSSRTSTVERGARGGRDYFVDPHQPFS